ncbi:MAG: methyltransferase [Pseudomonadales bacterium]
MAASHRDAANSARDIYRHPAETLEFFQFEEGLTVVEVAPGGGWYTEILAPALGKNGKLYAAHHPADAEREYYRKSRKGFEEKIAADPQVYASVVITNMATGQQMAPPASADLVLTFRNVHNWMKSATAQQVFATMYAALKPGGLLGVVEHRAHPDTREPIMIQTGYVTESRVQRLAKDAGFEFVASSDINANPKDSHDHPKGVWTLPPRLALGDEDRAKYFEIGESDRMTLLFRKPK